MPKPVSPTDDNVSAELTGKSNADLFIGEVEAGVQWNAPLKCVPADAFFRVALDYQYWGTGGVPEFLAVAAAGPTLATSAPPGLPA